VKNLEQTIIIGGELIPVKVTEGIWKKVLAEQGGALVKFGKLSGESDVSGIKCVNKSGKEITLYGKSGVGVLKLDRKLNTLVFNGVPVGIKVGETIELENKSKAKVKQTLKIKH